MLFSQAELLDDVRQNEELRRELGLEGLPDVRELFMFRFSLSIRDYLH